MVSQADAGAYLGWRGAAVALLMGVATRGGIGGPGALSGRASMAICAIAGLAWLPAVGEEGGRDLPATAALAGQSLLHLLPVLLLRGEAAFLMIRGTSPVMVLVQVLGVLLVGILLERERALLAEGQRLSLAAERAPLTGLHNRRGLEAEGALRRAEFTGSALLLIDLDHFKRVNDLHGHVAGDEVLRQVAQRLRRIVDGRGVVGRIGGEELAVFRPSILPRETALLADHLRRATAGQSYATPTGAVAVTTSVGVAWSTALVEIEVLALKADLALYAAKAAGRDCCRLAATGPETSERLTRLPLPAGVRAA